MKKKPIKIKSNPNHYSDAVSCLDHPVLWRAGIAEVAKEHGFCADTQPDIQFEPWLISFAEDDENSEHRFSLASLDERKLYFFVIRSYPDDIVFVLRASTKQRSDGRLECVIKFEYIAKLWDSEEPLFHTLVNEKFGY